MKEIEEERESMYVCTYVLFIYVRRERERERREESYESVG
jgi:hypothetical protein